MNFCQKKLDLLIQLLSTYLMYVFHSHRLQFLKIETSPHNFKLPRMNKCCAENCPRLAFYASTARPDTRFCEQHKKPNDIAAGTVLTYYADENEKHIAITYKRNGYSRHIYI